MNKNIKQYSLKEIINSTDHNIATLNKIIISEEEQGECTCALNAMALDMKTSLLVLRETIDEELLEYNLYQIHELTKQLPEIPQIFRSIH